MRLRNPVLAVAAGIAVVLIFVVFSISGMNFEEERSTSTQQPQLITTEEHDTPPTLTMAVFTENRSPVLGSDDAPITLVEFGDYQCAFCNRFFHQTEDAIVTNYVDAGKVKMFFKDFTIIGLDSLIAANASPCAQEQGKFWEYHDILYNNWAGENNGWASRENLYKFAGKVGLDEVSFDVCMKEKRYDNVVANSKSDDISLGITGTPAFFVISPDNEVTKINGAQPYEVFERIFDSYLEN